MFFDPTHFSDKLQEDPTGIVRNCAARMKQAWEEKPEYDDLSLTASSQLNI